MAAVSLPSSQQKQATPPFPLHQPPHFAKKQWKTAAVLARDLPDPWAELGFERIAQETVTRHMYNPRSGRWKTDQVVIKVQSEVWVKESWVIARAYRQTPSEKRAGHATLHRHSRDLGEINIDAMVVRNTKTVDRAFKRSTVEPLLTDTPNSGHLHIMGCTDCYYHRNSTFLTSEKRPPLYSGQPTPK